jgi:hypothetical protein
MGILLVVVAIALVSLPVAAVLLVSFAVFREDSLRSLAGRAPGSLESLARRLLAARAQGSCSPIARTRVRDALDFQHGAFDPVGQYGPAFQPMAKHGPVFEPLVADQFVVGYQSETPHEPAVFREPVATAAAAPPWRSGS